MRIAVVTDVHGNLTAFEAVLRDLREVAPDLILHGGDLADSGSNGAEVVDRIRDLGWRGVVGNTDEMLFRPECLKEFADVTPALKSVLGTVEGIAQAAREALGQERLDWLASLPTAQVHGPLTLVHASPRDLWRAPSPEASDEQLQSVFGGLGTPIAVYGHIHLPYVRSMGDLTVANAGSVGLPYDGDPRASYALIDDGKPTIRRVAYDVEQEIRALATSPHADWMARMLRSGSRQPL